MFEMVGYMLESDRVNWNLVGKAGFLFWVQGRCILRTDRGKLGSGC